MADAVRAITFVTPHQRPNSGGVYTIQQFARHAPPSVRATLVVNKGELRSLDGVDVVSRRALGGVMPDADALIVPADAGDAAELSALPPTSGMPILLLQGYGAPGNPIVRDNLARGAHVLAGAGWLDDDARAAGCETAFVRYGLDRSLFSPADASRERGETVGLMTSTVDWKGTADGLEAVRLARREVPGLRLRTFGTVPPELGAAEHLPAPPAQRGEIARLMGGCDVFVCSSWEEGFGLPGLEALACGAALATTDTKGSRDYAVDGETALVSPPRDPAALAAHIVQLLRDGRLRRRLAADGRRRVLDTYAPWEDAGPAFLDAVVRLVAAARDGGAHGAGAAPLPARPAS